MKAPIPWLRVFVEGVVIVGSILLAFGLQAWWEGRQEREEERILLTSLLREFQANQEQLDTRIGNHQRIARAAGALSDLVMTTTSDEVTVPDTLLPALFISPTFDPTMGALEEAQSSGRTGLIRNTELRDLLRAWTGTLRDAQEEERKASELVQNEFYVSIARSVYLADLMRDGAAWLAGHPSAVLRESQRALPVTPSLANYARQRAVRSGLAARELAGLRSRLEAIIILLEAEIGG